MRSWWFFLVVCVLAAFAVRLWVVSGYSIPTGSMEPFFHGDRENGDRVAVFRPHYDLFGSPERFDLVAFTIDRDRLGDRWAVEGPETTTVCVVKRAVGLPGERIEIRDDGDVFVGSGAEPLLRVRKSLPLIESILIPVYTEGFGEDFSGGFFDRWKSYARVDGVLREDRLALEQCWSVEEGKLLCDAARPELRGRRVALTYGAEIDDGFLNNEGAFEAGLYSVKDVVLTIEIEILETGDRGGIFGDLSGEGDEFGFELHVAQMDTAGAVIDGGRSGLDQEDFEGLKAGRRYTISLLNIDDQIGLVCNGEVLVFRPYERGRLDPWCNIPWFGVFGVKAVFHGVRIDRDIHYTQAGTYGCSEPWSVPEDKYFLMGDNSRMSGDSRYFGGVSADSIIGRPFMIFSPVSRMRFF